MTLAIGIGLIAFATACFAYVWIVLGRRSRAMDSLGETFGVKRWKHETDDHYSQRIRNRIAITGGRHW